MSDTRRRQRRLGALLCLTAQLSGCASVLMSSSRSNTGESPLQNGCNVTRYSVCRHIPQVYAGAAFDACTIAWGVTAIPNGLAKDPVPTVLFGPAFVGFVVLAAVDMPASAVVDTVLLPITLPQQSERGDACPVGWTPIPPYERNIPKPPAPATPAPEPTTPHP